VCAAGETMVRKQEILSGMMEITNTVKELDDCSPNNADSAATISASETILHSSGGNEKSSDFDAEAGVEAIAAAFVAFGVRSIEHLVLEVMMMMMMMMVMMVMMIMREMLAAAA
jgi:hypothetical protein